MKTYLSFKEDEQEELRTCLNGWKYKSFIDEFDQRVFRQILKYDDYSFFLEEGIKVVETERDEFILRFCIDKLREKYWRLYEEEVKDKT